MAAKGEKLAASAVEMFEPGLAAEVIAQGQAVNSTQKTMKLGVDLEAIIPSFFLPPIPTYAKMKTGEITGLPRVVWNGFYDDARPKFLFVPDPDKPFRFKDSTGRVFEPRIMDTDGGTIPSILHGLMRYSPWGYGMGYIIHDWLFVAHRCAFNPDDDVDFEASARILGEAIKTVMEVGFTDFDGVRRKFPRDANSCMNIYYAVRSEKARKFWDDKKGAVCRT